LRFPTTTTTAASVGKSVANAAIGVPSAVAGNRCSSSTTAPSTSVVVGRQQRTNNGPTSTAASAGCSSSTSSSSAMDIIVPSVVGGDLPAGLKPATTPTITERMANKKMELLSTFRLPIPNALLSSRNGFMSSDEKTYRPPSHGIAERAMYRNLMIIEFDELEVIPKRPSLAWEKFLVKKIEEKQFFEMVALGRETYKEDLVKATNLKEFSLAKFKKGDDAKYHIHLLSQYSNCYEFPSFDILESLYDKKKSTIMFLVAPVRNTNIHTL
jgi:hypothetical protein